MKAVVVLSFSLVSLFAQACNPSLVAGGSHLKNRDRVSVKNVESYGGLNQKMIPDAWAGGTPNFNEAAVPKGFKNPDVGFAPPAPRMRVPEIPCAVDCRMKAR